MLTHNYAVNSLVLYVPLLPLASATIALSWSCVATLRIDLSVLRSTQVVWLSGGRATLHDSGCSEWTRWNGEEHRWPLDVYTGAITWKNFMEKSINRRMSTAEGCNTKSKNFSVGIAARIVTLNQRLGTKRLLLDEVVITVPAELPLFHGKSAFQWCVVSLQQESNMMHPIAPQNYYIKQTQKNSLRRPQTSTIISWHTLGLNSWCIFKDAILLYVVFKDGNLGRHSWWHFQSGQTWMHSAYSKIRSLNMTSPRMTFLMA